MEAKKIKATKFDINTFTEEWLRASNDFDTDTYLTLHHKDIVLNDTSVGEIFKGHAGLTKYFEEYFIGYNTQTSLKKITDMGDNTYRIDALFDGNAFKNLDGVFELSFKQSKIITVKCYLK